MNGPAKAGSLALCVLYAVLCPINRLATLEGRKSQFKQSKFCFTTSFTSRPFRVLLGHITPAQQLLWLRRHWLRKWLILCFSLYLDTVPWRANKANFLLTRHHITLQLSENVALPPVLGYLWCLISRVPSLGESCRVHHSSGSGGSGHKKCDLTLAVSGIWIDFHLILLHAVYYTLITLMCSGSPDTNIEYGEFGG